MKLTALEKTRLNRLRRMASRQAVTIRASRRRDPNAIDYGLYLVVDPNTNVVVARSGSSEWLTIDEVEDVLDPPPYGWNDEERATLAIMRELRVAKMGLAEIAAELNARGLKPRQGDRWRVSSVLHALTSKARAEQEVAHKEVLACRVGTPEFGRASARYAEAVQKTNNI